MNADQITYQKMILINCRAWHLEREQQRIEENGPMSAEAQRHREIANDLARQIDRMDQIDQN
jgi:hypothetical protein